MFKVQICTVPPKFSESKPLGEGPGNQKFQQGPPSDFNAHKILGNNARNLTVNTNSSNIFHPKNTDQQLRLSDGEKGSSVIHLCMCMF